MVKRRQEIDKKSQISLPGDSVKNNEQVAEAAKRVLYSQTGLRCPLYRFKSFEDPARLDGTELEGLRVITKGYLGFSNEDELHIGDLAESGEFVNMYHVPSKMLYDHRLIFDSAIQTIKKAAENHLVPLTGMPETFTITQMQTLYEVILEKALDKRNFRRSVLTKDYLEETGDYLRGTNFRPAKLYRFNNEKFQICLDRELEKLPVILF